MSRKLPFGVPTPATTSVNLTANPTSTLFRQPSVKPMLPQQVQPNSQHFSSFMNNASTNINGNISSNGKSNFTKLNKQSTMLYMHHHQSSSALGSQPNEKGNS